MKITLVWKPDCMKEKDGSRCEVVEVESITDLGDSGKLVLWPSLGSQPMPRRCIPFTSLVEYRVEP
jgi:hypothetical protein